jgi:hypothetical protein
MGAPLLTPLHTPTRTIVATSEYEERSRGIRVCGAAFVVYVDHRTFTYAEQIREVFHLPDDALFRTSLHYKNAKYLPPQLHFPSGHQADYRI